MDREGEYSDDGIGTVAISQCFSCCLGARWVNNEWMGRVCQSRRVYSKGKVQNRVERVRGRYIGCCEGLN